MKRLGSLLVSTLLLACAHAQPTKVVTPVPPRSAAAEKSATRGEPFELPALGLAGTAPCPPQSYELHFTIAEGPMDALGVSCSVDSDTFIVMRYFRRGRDRGDDETLLANSKNILTSITQEKRFTLGEMPGLELEGKSKKGEGIILRSYANGDGFWVAQVTHERDKPGSIDLTRARAFLDSLKLTQPWSLHAFPEAHFSVLFPDGGVQLDKESLKVEDADFADAVWLGGSERRVFVVWGWTLEGNATAEERLSEGTARVEQAGNRVVWQSPLVVDGVPARDILLQSEQSWMRMRLIVTGTNLYVLQASAKTKPAVLDDSVTRFLASFRTY